MPIREIDMHTYIFAFRCDACGNDWTEFRTIENHEDADDQWGLCTDCYEGEEVQAHF
jgi:hypothetical protein